MFPQWQPPVWSMAVLCCGNRCRGDGRPDWAGTPVPPLPLRENYSAHKTAMHWSRTVTCSLAYTPRAKLHASSPAACCPHPAPQCLIACATFGITAIDSPAAAVRAAWCCTLSLNLVTPPCSPEADVGLIIMELRYYVPMSGSNTIATVTALLETGMVPMRSRKPS